jgi:hypothetical protein
MIQEEKGKLFSELTLGVAKFHVHENKCQNGNIMKPSIIIILQKWVKSHVSHCIKNFSKNEGHKYRSKIKKK